VDESTLLLIVLFTPALGGMLIALFKHLSDSTVRWTALAFTFLPFIVAVGLFLGIDNAASGLQFEVQREWFQITEGYSIQFFLGVDGLSMPLVLLTAFLGFISVLASWKIENRVREYFAWMLVMISSIIGVFCAQDLLLFFLFWEVELVPMYFLISIWGSGRKDYSAMKYVMFTLFGSAMMLAGILALFFSLGTLDMTQIQSEIAAGNYITYMPLAANFFILLIGFCIKLPLFPFHTWLPDAHTDAPTAVSIMLAGALLKMGGYGIIRVFGWFPGPAQDYAWIFAVLAVISIVYGAAAVFRQTDLKKLIAYSSVSHMGFVMLGVCALGTMSITGAALQMVSHGLITGLLFAMVGMAYGKTHTRHIPDLGGLARQMPVICVVFMFAGFASVGLPGTSGFAAEVQIFVGSFMSEHVEGIRIFTAIAATGVVLGAGYTLWMVERVFHRAPKEEWDHLEDADGVEKLHAFLLVGSIVLIGVAPWIFNNMIQPVAETIALS
jgi:NADH-quinone oxidoreductase subunit M